jgi:calcium-dependent protein kinase
MSDNKVIIQKSNFISSKTTPISKEYIMGKTLGKGAFGTVRLCVHKATKQTRACKILKKANQDMQALYEEVEILSKLSHPNIMQIYEVFNDKTNFYIVSEFCQGGELFDAISKKGSFSENEAARIMKQVLSAICYSHQNNIVHRDLKPENILLDDKGSDLTIKIIDWGCAKSFKKNEKMTNADGTPYYIAPEVLEGNYDEKCDVWSCGVILYIMLCGYPPFNGETDDDILVAVKKGKYDFPKEEWSSVSKEAIELINGMLTYEPNKRLSALDCMNQSWFIKNKGKNTSDKKMAKNVLGNMKKFKRDRKLEQATIGFIVNQLISKEERKELVKQFQEWDTNGDGVLSREEIIEGYRKTYGAVDENEIDNMMMSIDLDGNGVIDYNEFLSCAFNRDKIMSKDNLELTFKAFDSDGSGKISVDELMTIFTKGDKGHANREVFEKMVKEADENGDGEISFQEFKTIMAKFFS